MPRRMALRWLGSVGLAGVGTALLPSAQAASLKVGQPAPPATLTTFEGQRLSTGQYLGQVVILTFWATWCVPDRKSVV